ncbi:DUF928 domain-containing protein [Capilliphycus salinus ALCB114379]|uniref:DUF928 domain-containing protein n=1 Tax=Capilliphycus salinus TaxID=2768948 RepID=UPI0039A512D6
MMISIQWFLNKRPNIALINSCFLALTLIATPVALANYVPGDQKPVPPERKSDGGTTRGCSAGDIPLTVLASRNYVGQTISQRPMFAWFVPPDSASKEMKFIIYELVSENNYQEIRAISLQTTPGIMKLSPFSENDPGLEVGKEYVWQVVIFCDPSSLSSAIVDRASIKVVTPPHQLQSQLILAANGVEKARIYARAGLWYNALGEALKLAEPSKLGEMGSALLKDLAEWETSRTTLELTPQEQEMIEKRVENLEQIANSTR